MDTAKLRAFWFEKQGLGSANLRSPREVLLKCGWARSVGGANPYLTIYARTHLGRQAVDRDVSTLEIHELPSARGCTYVLPKDDFALGLRAAQVGGRSRDTKVAMSHLGVTEEELRQLSDKVEAVVESGALDPAHLKDAVGPVARSLGEEGKKRGINNTLSLVLGPLQASGRIRRVPVSGRLDEQRFKYVRWHPNPLDSFDPSPAALALELATRFFAWSAPSTLAQFRTFSDLGANVAKEAVDALNLVALEPGCPYLASPEIVGEYRAFEPPETPCVSFIGSLDSFFLLRRDANLFLDPEHHGTSVPEFGAFATVGNLSDLTANAILDRGRLIGFWEFDPEVGEVVYWSFEPPTDSLKSAARDMSRFVSNELQDVRSFSLDSPKSRKPKLEAIRRAAARSC